jgi:uncharacterized radical SAM superfamily Fe-S cluster-containing enzyme
MLFIHKTTSLCDECYRHVPAVVYEDNNSIMMTKNCPTHGQKTSVVEIDKDFYYGLEHHRDVESFNQVLFEASDRCQLSCPHCYHLPDNKVQDRPISDVIEQLSQFPRDSSPMLAGAEATLRPDFVELCREINKLGFKKFELLSNGLRFASKKFTKDCFNAGLKTMCLGLNHPSYQGQTVHKKQLSGLQNMIEHGYDIGYVGYTIEDYDHLEFILNEIKEIDHKQINHYRIRCGSFIGRSSDQQRSYLSTLVSKIRTLTNNEIVPYSSDDNPYHVMVNWNGILLRLIQWPDVTNIDLEELATGPWCQFYDGPITNFVHQVITRDSYKNMSMPQLDIVPERYQYRSMSNSQFDYWKHNWQGPVEFTEFDWTTEQIPKKVKTVIPMRVV